MVGNGYLWTIRHKEPAPLGAVVDLRRAGEGLICIRNKPSRVLEIASSIDTVLATRAPDPKHLERIRGRLLFASTALMGRVGGMALRALTAACTCGGARQGRPLPSDVVDELHAGLRLLKFALVQGPPREIHVGLTAPALVFTDGTLEGLPGQEVASIGGVLVDPRAGAMAYFAAVIGNRALRVIMSECLAPIVAVELLGVYVAMRVFSGNLSARPSIIFVDNDAARQQLVRGGARCALACELVEAVCRDELRARVLAFYERDPSKSNIADAPSRGEPPAPLRGWAPPARVMLGKQDLLKEHRLLVGGRDARL